MSAANSSQPVAVHPGTGEVLEHLDEQPPEALAEALDAVNARKDELKRWGDALESELRRRLKLRQTKLAVFGDWEVEASISRARSWDADALEAAMDNLVGDGVIRAGDIADVITRPPVVAGSKALDLARRLDGDARAQVEACFTWREKPGKLTVARSVDLLNATPDPAEERAPSLPPGVSPADPQAEPAPTSPLTPEELFA